MIESLLAGGLTGVIGSLFSNIFDFLKLRQNAKLEIEKKKLDIQAMDKEYQYALEMSSKQLDASVDMASLDTMGKSYEHDQASYSAGLPVSGWGIHALTLVDVIRGLVRPIMTGVLLAVLYDTRMEVEAVIEAVGVEKMDVYQALILYSRIVDSIIFMAVSAGLWWFGTRSKKERS